MFYLDRAARFIHESNLIERETRQSLHCIRHQLTTRSRKGHVGAFRLLMRRAAEGLTPSRQDLFVAHALVLNEQYHGGVPSEMEGEIGCWRTCGVTVGRHVGPAPSLVPAMMADLLDALPRSRADARTPDDAVNYVADAHHAFLRVHPFADGNGRVSRLLANALLAMHGLPLAVFTSGDRFDSYYPSCALGEPGLMRAYLRAKIVHPDIRLDLDHLVGWLDALPRNLDVP